MLFRSVSQSRYGSLDDIPSVEHVHESHVHVFVVRCEQLQLFHIHFLQKRVQVDALDQALNVAVQLLVLLRRISVLNCQLFVAVRQILQLNSLLLFQALELGQSDLLS